MSAEGNSFTYRGTDAGGASYNCYVTGGNYARMPRPRLTVDELAQADGAAMQGSTYSPLEITLQCQMTAADRSSLLTQMDALVALLSQSQANGGGDLTVDIFPDKVFTNARLRSGIDAITSSRMEQFTLEFVADSWWAGAAATDSGDDTADGSGTTVYSR